MRAILVAAAVVVSGLVSTNEAHAWLKFCNSSDTTVWVSYVRHDGACSADGQPWLVRGWWQMAPYACATVDGSDLQTIGSSYLYFRGEGADGTVWSGAGQYAFSVSQNAFSRCIDLGVSCGGCGNETHRKPFGEFNVGGYNNYTFTFWKNPPLHAGDPPIHVQSLLARPGMSMANDPAHGGTGSAWLAPTTPAP